MRPRLIGIGAAVLLLVVVPFALSDFRTLQLASVGTLFIAILGLDVLTGSSGQISLGNGAFMAVGGYTTAILVGNHGVRDVWTIPAAAAIAGAAGVLVGIPALRISGFYLALLTFGLAIVLPTVIQRFDHFTGGTFGISFFGSPHETGHGAGVTLLGGRLTNNQWLYVLTWMIAVPLFFLAWWLVASRFGRSLRAARDSELGAAASGVNRTAYKVSAFAVSAAYAGVAGALLAIENGYVSPSSFPIQLSLYLVVGAVAGLYGSIWGAALGALLIEYLPGIVGAFPHVTATQPGPTTFALGAILVVLMLVLPAAIRLGGAIASRGYPRAR